MKSLGFILPAFLVSLVFLGSDNPYLPPNHSDSASVLGVLALLLLVFNLQKLKSKTGEAVVLSPLILVLVYFLGWLALGYWYTVRLDLSYEWIVKSLFAVPLALGLVLFLKDKKTVARHPLDADRLCQLGHCVWHLPATSAILNQDL